MITTHQQEWLSGFLSLAALINLHGLPGWREACWVLRSR